MYCFCLIKDLFRIQILIEINCIVSGCLLENTPRPPDVPPRNPTMNRLNGRLASAPPVDPREEFEPSCLVQTPSGNVYIPSGTLSK